VLYGPQVSDFDSATVVQAFVSEVANLLQVVVSDIVITSIRAAPSAQKQAQGVVVDFVVLFSGDFSASQLADRFDYNPEQLAASINTRFESEGIDIQVVGVGAVTVIVIIAASPFPAAASGSGSSSSVLVIGIAGGVASACVVVIGAAVWTVRRRRPNAATSNAPRTLVTAITISEAIASQYDTGLHKAAANNRLS